MDTHGTRSHPISSPPDGTVGLGCMPTCPRQGWVEGRTTEVEGRREGRISGSRRGCPSGPVQVCPPKTHPKTVRGGETGPGVVLGLYEKEVVRRAKREGTKPPVKRGNRDGVGREDGPGRGRSDEKRRPGFESQGSREEGGCITTVGRRTVDPTGTSRRPG